MKNANEKIDAASKAAKLKAERVIDDITEVVGHAATKAGRHIHDAGSKVKHAGDKLMKLADRS